MIKNIIFDMGGVLIDWSPEEYINRYSLTDEEKQILNREIFQSYNWSLMDFGYYKTEEDFLDDVCKNIPEKLIPTARSLVLDWDSPRILNYRGMEELIKQLKENGYGIYLLSNAGPRHSTYWNKVAGSQYFDGKVVSAEICQYKPCKDIYETVLKKYNLKADECVFTDDLPVNCAAAFLCGINPVVFRGPEDFKKELRKLGVKI